MLCRRQHQQHELVWIHHPALLWVCWPYASVFLIHKQVFVVAAAAQPTKQQQTPVEGKDGCAMNRVQRMVQPSSCMGAKEKQAHRRSSIVDGEKTCTLVMMVVLQQAKGWLAKGLQQQCQKHGTVVCAEGSDGVQIRYAQRGVIRGPQTI